MDELEPAPLAPPVEPAPRRRYTAVIVSLAVGLPLLIAGGVVGVLAVAAALKEPEPPRLTASQSDRIEVEVAERGEVLLALDEKRDEYRTAEDEWDQSVSWAEDAHGPADQPVVAVPNPGGSALPGDDPAGRAFLDSIGATDVQVVFDAGPDNCGYYGNGGGPYTLYAGGCFRGEFPNTLYMAWDPGAEDVASAIFVHEAMHWFQAERYAQDTYLADFAGIDSASYSAEWEADASCRAVYVYGRSLADYADTTSPCTIDGWYEGWIADYLTSRGAQLTEPDPATYELAESSRP